MGVGCAVLDWSRLRVLDAVARAGSVGGAAAALHMTSPAVSHQLRRIEADLGCAVVEPAGRGVRLTDAGRRLAECARAVADLVQGAENDVAAGRPAVGVVRVGALASLVRGLLAPVLAAHLARHPGVRVEVVDGESVDHVAALREGRLDLVLAASWSARPAELPAGLVVDELGVEDVGVAMPAADAGEGSVRLADLADRAWASCPPGSDDHGALVQAARAAGVELDVRYTVSDHVTQSALVAAGVAVGLVPATACTPAPAGVTLRGLDPPMHRALRLLRRREEAPLAVTRFAADLARAAAG